MCFHKELGKVQIESHLRPGQGCWIPLGDAWWHLWCCMHREGQGAVSPWGVPGGLGPALSSSRRGMGRRSPCWSKNQTPGGAHTPEALLDQPGLPLTAHLFAVFLHRVRAAFVHDMSFHEAM